jgi:Transcription factor Iwr1
MSRSATPVGPTPTVAGRKRKDATVFIERKRPRSSDGQTHKVHPDDVAQQQDATKQDASQDQDKPGPGFAEPQPEDRPRKKPGLAARTSVPPVRPRSPLKPNVAPLRNVRLPSGAMMPWDVSSEQLAAEMQAYTMEEIGRTLARQEAEAAAEASRKAVLKPALGPAQKHPSKFKPKKPALRYLERHPEERAAQEHNTAMDVDETHIEGEDEDMDDGEYIIDTYVRVPAHALETEEQSKNFGLLVLDSQPDIDEFYREEEDSEEEDDDEEEDENGQFAPPDLIFVSSCLKLTRFSEAENHYTADYPDEEVASDDEYDRNAYNYRTGNASDLEEFDEEYDEGGVVLSDNEGDATRYPWKTKPWMKRPGEKSILDEETEE